MATAKKRNSVDRGQGTISFARQARRSEAKSPPPPAAFKAKLNSRPKQALTPRVVPSSDKSHSNAADSNALSPAAVEEILNGADSQALLKELRKDRFEFPRFHQDGMPVSQKVLREFDMIQDFGPCQGLTRLQRWNRAERFGKKPPPQIKKILDAAKSRPDYKDEFELSVFGPLH